MYYISRYFFDTRTAENSFLFCIFKKKKERKKAEVLTNTFQLLGSSRAEGRSQGLSEIDGLATRRQQKPCCLTDTASQENGELYLAPSEMLQRHPLG